jgi:hypothetical protein
MTSTAHSASRRRTRRDRPFDRLLARGLAALELPEAPYLVLLAGFIGVGLFLRLDRLGAQSLWFDEADAVLLARQPLSVLIGNLGAAGQNGPLYTLFMHLWILIFGSGEATVRLPSALAGAACIPLIYALGRALHGPKLGLYAAGILTIAPYQHWYAQEAKMYAPLVCATLASTLALLGALRDDRPRRWVIYVVIMTIALYLHVMAALVIVAHGLAVALLRWRGGNAGAGATGPWFRRLPRAAWAFAALTLPYLPIALWELQFVSSGAITWHQPIGPLAFLRDLFTKFATGVRADTWTGLRGLILFCGLALLGLLPLSWRTGPWSAPALTPRQRSIVLGCATLVPLGLFYLLQLVRPLYADRYLIVVTPALILLVAGGLLALERFARPLALVGLAAIVATSWVSLRDVNLAEAAQKEDWRAAYAQIAEHWHPNDLIIIQPGYLETTFDYYALRDERLDAMTTLTIPNEYFDGTTDEQSIDGFLQRATVGYERVWIIVSPDRLALIDPFDRRGDCESDRLRNWYCYNAHQLVERELNGLWLGLYAYNRPYGAAFYPPPAVRLDQPVGDRLTLVGYGYDFAPGASSVSPGESLPLLIHWAFREKDGTRFGLRWQLRDEAGRVIPEVGATEPLLGDNPPVARERSPYFWDYHDLSIPANLAPGRYRLVVAVVGLDRPEAPLAPGSLDLGWFEVR